MPRMRLVVGSDEDTLLVQGVVQTLAAAGHNVTVVGPPAGQELDWADVGWLVGQQVASGEADRGVALCWTGTGVSIAANRVPGCRAALCADAETARGARRWNDANVLVLSNRLTSPPVGAEIVRAWLEADVDPAEADAIAKLDR